MTLGENGFGKLPYSKAERNVPRKQWELGTLRHSYNSGERLDLHVGSDLEYFSMYFQMLEELPRHKTTVSSEQAKRKRRGYCLQETSGRFWHHASLPGISARLLSSLSLSSPQPLGRRSHCLPRALCRWAWSVCGPSVLWLRNLLEALARQEWTDRSSSQLSSGVWNLACFLRISTGISSRNTWYEGDCASGQDPGHVRPTAFWDSFSLSWVYFLLKVFRDSEELLWAKMHRVEKKKVPVWLED